MDIGIVASCIGAVATIVGAMIARSQKFDLMLAWMRSGVQLPSLVGEWVSSWTEEQDGATMDYREVFHITRHRGERVWGYILMDAEKERDKKWDIEGVFDGQYLQLLWRPAKDSPNRFFQDCGCCFFTRRGDGTFTGIAVGVDWSSEKPEIDEHRLVPRK